MTKYILHGGGTKWHSAANDRFFTAITENLTNQATILVVCYAKDPAVWSEVLEAVTQTFRRVAPSKNLKLELAESDTAKFIEQIKRADALYLMGGNSHFLQEYLARVPQIEKLWSAKVVAGSSAGALVLSRYYYENDDDTYNEGLGILPIITFCHYSADEADKLAKLKRMGKGLEIYAIPEQKFYVIKN